MEYEDDQDENTEFGFYYDDVSFDAAGIIASEGIVKTGPLSSRTSQVTEYNLSYSYYLFQESLQTGFNDDGILYIATKGLEVEFKFEEDADDDGLLDAWEIDFFGSTNAVNGGASEDFDDDGMNNLDEYISGMNPTNSASVFTVQLTEVSDGGKTVSWNSVSNRQYAVYWTGSLTNDFTLVEEYIFYPDSSFTDWTYSSFTEQGFFRVEVKLAE